MNAARKKKRRRSESAVEPAAATREPVLQGEFPRWACLACFAALVVASPLLPGEAAAEKGVYNPIAVAWLACAALCAAVVVVQPKRAILWSPAMLCVAGLGLWMGVATLAGWTQLHPRPALNMTFVYLGAAACVFAGVQLFAADGEARTRVTALLLAMGTALAIFGLFQFAVTIPAAAEEYFEADEQQKQNTLIRYNLDPTEGSADRRHFEDRLTSTEPFATFGLANSLAGFLAPVLVLALAAGVHEARDQRRVATLASLLAIIGLCGVCLVFTKSRTAYLAFLVGAGLFAALYFGRRFSIRHWLFTLGGGAAAIGLVGTAAVLSGGLDLKVLSESLKSFQYRVEYWRATLAMIADRPLFGCGPGQFQSVYSRYKLPQASETVADPHNFLLEICATGGVPALLLLLAAIVLAVVYRRATAVVDTADSDAIAASEEDAASDSNEPERPQPPEPKPAASPLAVAVNIGAGLGVVVALAAGAMTDHVPDGWAFIATFAAFVIAAPLTWRAWTLPPAAVVAALATWCVHHLASGGFGFPGVAIALWVLAALYFAGSARGWSPGGAVRIGLLVGITILILAGMQFATRPLEARHAFNSVLMGNSMADVRRLSMEASTMDPFWVDPVARLAGADHYRWLDSRQERYFKAYEATETRMIAMDPQTWIRHRQAGHWRLMGWRLLGEKRHLDAAIRFYEQALERYPNSLDMLAQMAWAQHLAGNEAEASRLAGIALELNAIHPHKEQKLDRVRIHDFDPGPGRRREDQPEPTFEMAEPVLLRLRKSSGD